MLTTRRLTSSGNGAAGRRCAGPPPRGRRTRVEGPEADGHRRGGVALDEDPVGVGLGEELVDPAEDPARHLGRRLAHRHDVEVVVGPDPEQLQHLVEHLPVLAGDGDRAVDARPGTELGDDRRHLDGLRARPEHAEHPGQRPRQRTSSIRRNVAAYRGARPQVPHLGLARGPVAQHQRHLVDPPAGGQQPHGDLELRARTPWRRGAGRARRRAGHACRSSGPGPRCGTPPASRRWTREMATRHSGTPSIAPPAT